MFLRFSFKISGIKFDENEKDLILIKVSFNFFFRVKRGGNLLIKRDDSLLIIKSIRKDRMCQTRQFFSDYNGRG